LYECQTYFGDSETAGLGDQSAEKNIGTSERLRQLHIEELRWSTTEFLTLKNQIRQFASINKTLNAYKIIIVKM
jgi:hypothetical protein